MPNSKYYRDQIAGNLELIAEVFDRNQLISDTSPIHRAARICRNRTDDCWGYRIERLIFHKIGEIRIQPHTIKSADITVEVTIEIEGICNPTSSVDPLTKLSLDMLIISNDKAMGAWHLDRHTDAANFLHPSYHFQFGGKKLAYEPAQFGSILIADTPRIPHPPMDGILGIDFAVVNFWEAEKIKFRLEGNYTNILNQSIDMLWKPYIENLYGYWQANAHLQEWKPHTNWNQLPPKLK